MDQSTLADAFEEHRPRLTAIAVRMLGSTGDAEDAVQETWLRLHRTEDVQNLGGWLTTVLSRVCLDQLRSRSVRREHLDQPAQGVALEAHHPGHPEQEAELADALGAALLVVLDTLGPAERLAFVLHDLFGVGFEEIGGVLGRTPAASRQLASRARRRVQGAEEPDAGADRAVVRAFLTASRNGDFTALLDLLDPAAEVRADQAAARMGSPALTAGSNAVAQMFSGRAQAARAALIDGVPGAFWSAGGQVKVAFGFTIVEGRISEIELIADPDVLAGLEIVAG